jgi:hypothetical protein
MHTGNPGVYRTLVLQETLVNRGNAGKFRKPWCVEETLLPKCLCRNVQVSGWRVRLGVSLAPGVAASGGGASIKPAGGWKMGNHDPEPNPEHTHTHRPVALTHFSCRGKRRERKMVGGGGNLPPSSDPGVGRCSYSLMLF